MQTESILNKWPKMWIQNFLTEAFIGINMYYKSILAT